MFRIIITLFLIGIYLPGAAEEWDNFNTRKIIRDAEEHISKIDNNFELHDFIPHDIYTEAVINIRDARTELEKRSFLSAYFYAAIAIVKLKTAELHARARKLRTENISLERDYYKTEVPKVKTVKAVETKAEKKSVNPDLAYIIDANLLKRGNTYKTDLLDKKLFNKTEMKISGRGMGTINKIVKVLENFASSNIKIVGHTSFYDFRRFSAFKSDVIKNYLMKKGISPERIESIGAGNRIVIDTPLGFRRLDRIEIIITGIE